MYGATDEGLPVVLLDRIESTLADTLPAMYGHEGEMRAPAQRLRSRRAGARAPAARGARSGAGPGGGGRRSRRARSAAGGDAHPPARRRAAVQSARRLRRWASRWLSNLEQYARFDRPGGPLLFDTDLRAVVARRREAARGANAQVLAAAVDVLASATEAHEARHALDEVDPNGPPPPPALFEVMGESSAQFVGMADAELRAYLGELHDTGVERRAGWWPRCCAACTGGARAGRRTSSRR